MNEDQEDAKSFDLSKSVNAACTKWLLGRGIKTGQWVSTRQIWNEANDSKKQAREEESSKEKKKAKP